MSKIPTQQRSKMIAQVVALKIRSHVRYEGELVELGPAQVPRVWLLEQRDESGEWPILNLRIEVRDGVPLIRDLQITATEQGIEVQSAHLRTIDLESLVEYVGSLVLGEALLWSGLPEGESDITGDDILKARQAGRAAARGERRRRKRTVTQAMLEEVARVYLAADTAPVRAVEEHFGKTRRTASWYVKQARDAGLLPESGEQ